MGRWWEFVKDRLFQYPFMFALVLETSFAFAFRPVISVINVQDPRIILLEDLEVLRRR
jgi:hypothetical protein